MIVMPFIRAHYQLNASEWLNYAPAKIRMIIYFYLFDSNDNSKSFEVSII